MAEAQGDMDVENAVKPFKTILTVGEILDIHKDFKSLKSTAFITKVLEVSNLSLAPISTEEQETSFKNVKDLMRKRWNNLHEKWKKSNRIMNQFNKETNDTFIDIEKDFPILVSYERYDVPNSQSSNVSTKSWIEDEVPVVKLRKEFEDLMPKQKRRHTDEIYEALISKAEELSIDPVKLICYLGSRASYMDNKRIAQSFVDLGKGKSDEMSLEKATYLKTHLWLSKQGWTELRLEMKNHQVRLPTSDELRAYKDSLTPFLMPFFGRPGFKAFLHEVIYLTLTRLPKDVMKKLALIPRGTKVIAFFTGGMDGSGSHKVYNSQSSLNVHFDAKSILFAGISLIYLKLDDEEGTMLYEVPNPCSSDNERPLILCPGKEEPELVEACWTEIHKGMEELKDEPPEIMINETRVKFHVNIKWSQIDGKLRTMSLGIGGAACTLCFSSQADIQNLTKINDGFKIERTLESIQETFDKLKTPDPLTGKPLLYLNIC